MNAGNAKLSWKKIYGYDGQKQYYDSMTSRWETLPLMQRKQRVS